MNIQLVENGYIRINDRIDVLFIVPILVVLGLIFMPFLNWLLLLLCLTGGFLCRYRRDEER